MRSISPVFAPSPRVSALFPMLAAACVLGSCLLAGCGGGASIKPEEVLDERTGMTVGTLEKPIELHQGNPVPMSSDRRASFAYLGPVEWDNMGNLSYGLWIHVAPGTDFRFDDIDAPGTVALSLDAAITPLTVLEPPALAHAPYRPAASWGATAYFKVDLAVLRHLAASAQIGLDVKAGATVVHFTADQDARETLSRFLRARGY